MPPIGFLILSYNMPAHLKRLAWRLTEAFDSPPIVCNHDFDQLALDPSGFPDNFTFVRPHVRTAWNSITCVHAVLNALRLLYKTHPPEWFFLLSGSDYPILPLDKTLAKLRSGGYDAYMDHRLLERGHIPEDHDQPTGFRTRQYLRNAYSRYHPIFFRVPWPPSPEGFRRIKFDGKPFERWNRVLNHGLKIYSGKHWFGANHRCADRFLNDSERVRLLLRYYEHRHVPEEAFYQTTLCNYPDLKISTDPLRYEDWSTNDWHPVWINEGHLPAMSGSGAILARKFKENSPVLDVVDRELLGVTPRPVKYNG